MKLLLIGGGQFVGHHLLEAALAAGHQVTVFNRGQSRTQWPAGVELRQGDRMGDLAALQHGEWDAVIDCCAYFPGQVRHLAQALRARVGRYVLISSVSAYAGFESANDEDSPLAQLPLGEDDPEVQGQVLNGRTYGPLKALCEQALLQSWGADAALCIRPGLVVGPQDPTQRFTYWPARVARAGAGEAVLAPGLPQRELQFIDARDLAAFVLQALAQGRSGAVNVVTDPGALSMQGLLDTLAQITACQPRWVWVDDAPLLAADVKPWNDLPLWLPAQHEFAQFMQVRNQRARAWGLQTRPVADTARDTLAWWQGLAPEQQTFTKAGLAPEREQALLETLA
ncbi:2'-hydroxyisoflavone reductase [Inhella inkyongensis]|uniref:2'-hydroxyisoflavone reductase n=1 Tax=Inhella inkyongensis TaxID=392593 RepID=A0A840S996_9BURK|nr:NAD-dependent epimerase/dehydratase family protein [Inhella inkyongensis]MBB5204980.1 2'-hydroxyisoflavone reductase [Inhella inkyongensis]